jgi:hypothetical protein
MPEYLQPFFENKCNACKIYDCVNTNLYANRRFREKLEERGVGRIRYDGGLTMSEHRRTVQDCPTRKRIDNVRKFVGSGLGWKLVGGITIRSALRKLDYTFNIKPDRTPPTSD